MKSRLDYVTRRRRAIDAYEKAHCALNSLWSCVIRIENAKAGAEEWYNNLNIGRERIQNIKYVPEEHFTAYCNRLIVTSHMLIAAQDLVWEPICDEATLADKIDDLLDKIETLMAILEE